MREHGKYYRWRLDLASEQRPCALSVDLQWVIADTPNPDEPEPNRESSARGIAALPGWDSTAE